MLLIIFPGYVYRCAAICVLFFSVQHAVTTSSQFVYVFPSSCERHDVGPLPLVSMFSCYFDDPFLFRECCKVLRKFVRATFIARKPADLANTEMVYLVKRTPGTNRTNLAFRINL